MGNWRAEQEEREREKARVHVAANVQFALYLARARARERLIPRVFYDLAIPPCCADFINSSSYLSRALPPSPTCHFRCIRYSRYSARISRVAAPRLVILPAEYHLFSKQSARWTYV
jgi:hypothetical protein